MIGISSAPVFEDGPAARAPQPFGQRAFRCSDSFGKLLEQWTLTRNLLDNTCTHKIEQFLAGRKADEIILTGQDCDYEPPCVREAKEIGTFNNGNNGKHKFEISFKTLGSIISFLMTCFELTFIGNSKQIIQKRKKNNNQQILCSFSLPSTQ